MTGFSVALVILCGSSAFSTAGRADPAAAVRARSTHRRTIAVPAGHLAFGGSDRVATGARLGNRPGDVRKLGVVAGMDRAEFFEETNEDIYHENKKNPWHAFILGLAPGLFYKPLAVGLSWKYCDKGEKAKLRSVAFLNAVPASGFGSFYAEWYWAGALSMVADTVGSALLTWYFYDEHRTRNDPGGSMTKFYAGVVVVASAWVFDIIMGPVGAIVYNKQLRSRYLSEAPAWRIYHMPPLPETGLATVGPQPSGPPPPVALGYAGRF